jgi:hypothetical protein
MSTASRSTVQCHGVSINARTVNPPATATVTIAAVRVFDAERAAAMRKRTTARIHSAIAA